MFFKGGAGNNEVNKKNARGGAGGVTAIANDEDELMSEPSDDEDEDEDDEAYGDEEEEPLADEDVDDEEEKDDEDEDIDEDLLRETQLQQPNFEEPDEDEDEDEDDDEDHDPADNSLQKFNEHLNMEVLENMHPEINQCNYDEMVALSRVIRDANGKIIDPLHRTLPFLTKYEKTHVIGTRAEQIDRGGQPFIDVDPSIISGRVIAMKEFEMKKIPFIIARPLPNGAIEYWNLSDLEVVHE